MRVLPEHAAAVGDLRPHSTAHLLIVLLAIADDQGRFDATNSQLATLLNTSARHITTYMGVLIHKGWLSCEARRLGPAFEVPPIEPVRTEPVRTESVRTESVMPAKTAQPAQLPLLPAPDTSPPRARRRPPSSLPHQVISLEEILDYARSTDLQTFASNISCADPARYAREFHFHYSEKGWPKDWKATFKKWLLRQRRWDAEGRTKTGKRSVIGQIPTFTDNVTENKDVIARYHEKM